MSAYKAAQSTHGKVMRSWEEAGLMTTHDDDEDYYSEDDENNRRREEEDLALLARRLDRNDYATDRVGSGSGGTKKVLVREMKDWYL